MTRKEYQEQIDAHLAALNRSWPEIKSMNWFEHYSQKIATFVGELAWFEKNHIALTTEYTPALTFIIEE